MAEVSWLPAERDLAAQTALPCAVFAPGSRTGTYDSRVLPDTHFPKAFLPFLLAP